MCVCVFRKLLAELRDSCLVVVISKLLPECCGIIFVDPLMPQVLGYRVHHQVLSFLSEPCVTLVASDLILDFLDSFFAGFVVVDVVVGSVTLSIFGFDLA